MLTLLLAALPLRGYAGVLMSLCESHHGGNPAAEQHDHKHGDSHHHDADNDGGPPHAASVCSVCASCCAGAGIASEANHDFAFRTPDTHRIPFLVRQVSGFVPEHLDRPPLAL